MFNTSKPIYDYFLFFMTRNNNFLLYYAFAHTCLILHNKCFFEQRKVDILRFAYILGCCKLRWLIFIGYNTFQKFLCYSHVKMEVYYDIIGYAKNYMVVNEEKSF